MIWAGAGDENTKFAASFGQLLTITKGKVVPVA
jgi:hypothetical protein